jgi:hypothetical protein
MNEADVHYEKKRSTLRGGDIEILDGRQFMP